MKLLKAEFELMLNTAKSMVGDARKTMLDSLRSATVVEVDAKGVESVIEIQIAEITGEAQKGLQQPIAQSPDQIAAIVKSAVDDALKAAGHKAPAPIGQVAQRFAIPKNARRVGALKAFSAKAVSEYQPDERAYRFGMWALACIGSDSAKAFCAEQGIHVKVSSEGSNSGGGYLVPEEFGGDIIQLLEKYGVARQLFKIRPMSSDVRNDPRRVSGLTASFTAENAAGSESTKAWDNVTLTAKKLTVLSRMSSELNEDSVISVGDDLMMEIAQAFALKEDTVGFTGTGIASDGGIVGVCPKLATLNGTDDGGGLILAAGNLFSEFILGNFNAAVGRLPQYADTANTQWVAHRTFYYGTMQRLELASGGVTAFEVREGNRVPKFLGYNVAISQVMPSADANSQIACTLGDHSLAASFGDRRQPAIAFSTEATVGGESVFERDQIAVRGTERIDINVHDVGSATAAGPVVGIISAAS